MRVLGRLGDKIFTTYSTQVAPGKIESKHTIAGGTGKYTGITGEWTGVRKELRPPVEGQFVTTIAYALSLKTSVYVRSRLGLCDTIKTGMGLFTDRAILTMIKVMKNAP